MKMRHVSISADFTEDQFAKLKELMAEFGITLASQDDGLVVSFHLTRNRPEEDESWGDTLFLRLTNEEYNAYYPQAWTSPSFLENFVRDRIRKGLASKEGWDSIVNACMDYNWGDFVMDLPMEGAGIFCSTNDIVGYPIVPGADLVVHQDEMLAPEQVPAVLTLNKSGGLLWTGPVTISFMDGNIEVKNPDFDYDLLQQADEGFVTLENGDRLDCDEDEEYMVPVKK